MVQVDIFSRTVGWCDLKQGFGFDLSVNKSNLHPKVKLPQDCMYLHVIKDLAECLFENVPVIFNKCLFLVNEMENTGMLTYRTQVVMFLTVEHWTVIRWVTGLWIGLW